MSFDNLMGYIMSISMCMQNFITIFHSVQEIGPFSLFQNFNDKCHFVISWTRCHQYQCVCKILLKYSKRFKSYRHFSRTGRGQNLHKLSGDYRALFESQSSVDFLRVVQLCKISTALSTDFSNRNFTAN